jgi:hypothetical protein
MALRLVYPGTPVGGTYFYDDQTPAPGTILEADDKGWRWNRTGYEPLVRATTIGHTVIVDYKPRGNDGLLRTMPAFLCHPPCDPESYNPAAVISGWIPPRVARRYRLPSDAFHIASGGISVREATYGETCYGKALPAGWRNRVTRGNATGIVARACSGQDECDIMVTSEFFGDPAPLCAKDFRIQWTCPGGRLDEVIAPAEALGQTLHFACADPQAR